MNKLFAALALVLALAAPAHADPEGASQLGVGFYFGYSCTSGFCQPDPYLQSPQLNVSIPYGNGDWGHATLPAGWVESGNGDADGWYTACDHPQNWNGHGYGTVSYDDGNGLAYTGAAVFDVQFADTSQVALPSGAICCWQSQGGPYKQPVKYFVRKIKIQSCTAGHTRTNRFIAVGCDGFTESVLNGEPNCWYYNMNWIHLEVSGF